MDSTINYKTRYLIAFWAVLIQMLLGIIQGWSALKNPFTELHGWTSPEAGFAFTLHLLFLGIAAAISGPFADRKSPQKIFAVSTVLLFSGLILTGIAAQLGSKLLLWIGYGVIAGFGSGMSHVTCLAVLVKWFPDKKGFITGTLILAFGMGFAFTGHIAPLLIHKIGLSHTFYLLGFFCLLVLLPASYKILAPPSNPLYTISLTQKKISCTRSIPLRMAIKKDQIFILWMIFLINVSAGVAIISNLPSMIQSQLGSNEVIAGTLMVFILLTASTGSIFWAFLSDQIGCKIVYLLLLLTPAPIFIALPFINNIMIFTFACVYILFCFGGGIATMPAFAADTFGTRYIGGIYGFLMAAGGLSGITGPALMHLSLETNGDYSLAFYSIGTVLALGAFLCALFNKPNLYPHRTGNLEESNSSISVQNRTVINEGLSDG